MPNIDSLIQHEEQSISEKPFPARLGIPPDLHHGHLGRLDHLAAVCLNLEDYRYSGQVDRQNGA